MKATKTPAALAGMQVLLLDIVVVPLFAWEQ
jgi:hypothetical protein